MFTPARFDYQVLGIANARRILYKDQLGYVYTHHECSLV